MRRTKGHAAAVFVFFVAVAGMSALGIVTSHARASAAASPPPTGPSNAGASTQPLGSSAPAPCAISVNTVPSQGYAINTLVSSTSTPLGDVVCVNVILQNLDGRSLTLASAAGMTISYDITGRDGAVVYSNSCASPTPGDPTASKGPISSWSCEGMWDTGAAYEGNLPGPGTYGIVAKVDVPAFVAPAQSVVGSTATISLSD
jgi:hypothetical protein